MVEPTAAQQARLRAHEQLTDQLWAQARAATLDQGDDAFPDMKAAHRWQYQEFARLVRASERAGEFFEPRTMRAIKTVFDVMLEGSLWVEIRRNVFRPAAHPEGDAGLDFNYLEACGYPLAEYLEKVPPAAQAGLVAAQTQQLETGQVR